MSPAAPARSAAPIGGHLALLGVQLCFGLFPLFGKWAFAAFDPRAVAGWRIGCGAVVFTAVAVSVHGARSWPRPRDLAVMQLGSLLGVVFNQVLFLEGLARTTAVNAGLLMLLIPAFTYLVSAAVGQERFSWPRGLGIAIAFAGTAPMFLLRGADLSAGHGFGNLLIAINTLSFSGYLVLSRPLARRYPPLVLIAWTYLLASWTVPLFAGGLDFVPPTAGARAWVSLALIVLLPTLLGYVLYVVGLARLPASTAASYVFLQPLIAGTAGVLVLGETMAPGTVVAAVAIFVGLGLVVRAR